MWEAVWVEYAANEEENYWVLGSCVWTELVSIESPRRNRGVEGKN